MMTNGSKQEYLDALRELYQGATKRQKQTMLDDCCRLCGYNRKYAIRLLNSKPKAKNYHKRGRKKLYHDPLIAEILKQIWKTTNLPCAKRLKAILTLWLPYFPTFIIPEDIKEKLLRISPATIDRILAAHRGKFTKKGLTTTKPGSIIRKRIPIKTSQWNESIPGFIEADSVAHCGTSTQGTYILTINCVDIATGWTEQRAVWGKGEIAVLEAIKSVEQAMPFTLKGFDCDNGTEFLNWHLVKYLDNRKKPVSFTRARAYHKNDNAHVENKNWTHIRQYLGYQRFEKQYLITKLNSLYTSQWNDYFNFFIPSVKLIDKHRSGAKTIKIHDQPKTPFQRLLESQTLSDEKKQQLKTHYKNLNPFKIQQQMMAKIKEILTEVNT